MVKQGIQIGAIILAAGASIRLGQAKQLIPYKGRTLLERTIEAIASAMPGPIHIVSGSEDAQIREFVAKHPQRKRIQLDYCLNWQEGMGSSLAYGVEQLTTEQPNLDAILVSVCDQPFLNADVLKKLLALQAAGPIETVACAYTNTVGPPACFAQADFPALKQLKGECGAKALLLARTDRIKTVPFEEGAFDIDTPEDYQRLLQTPQKTT